MDKKILCIAVMATLLTGCISSKINNASSTTKTLSNDIESFSKLSDKTIELNRVLNLREQQRNLSKDLIPGDETEDKERDKTSSTNFYSAYSALYRNNKVNDALILQNKYLVSYFKQLPLILEDKSVDIAGLVKNVDTLNQIIENKVTDDQTPVPGLSDVQSGIIAKALSKAFQARQYSLFKKANQLYSPIIIKALINQKLLFRSNAILASKEKINNEYYMDFIKLHGTYSNQYKNEFKILKSTSNPSIPIYSVDEIKKVEAQFNTPFILTSEKDIKKLTNYNPQFKSSAYIQECIMTKDEQDKDINYILSNNSNNWMTGESSLLGADSDYKFIYDIENNYRRNGNDLICNLINIVGLMGENRMNDLDLAKFEKNMDDYNSLLDFFSNKYLPKKE